MDVKDDVSSEVDDVAGVGEGRGWAAAFLPRLLKDELIVGGY